MEYALKFVGVLIATILVDVCWTYYFIKINEEDAMAEIKTDNVANKDLAEKFKARLPEIEKVK